jgi:hypothetical protein
LRSPQQYSRQKSPANNHKSIPATCMAAGSTDAQPLMAAGLKHGVASLTRRHSRGRIYP